MYIYASVPVDYDFVNQVAIECVVPLFSYRYRVHIFRYAFQDLRLVVDEGAFFLFCFQLSYQLGMFGV